MSDDNSYELPDDAGDFVDIETFEQILEMDDDDTREFSRSLVFGFFEQADNTFDDMDSSLDLSQLSALGHFLKGSSATLGIYKVRDSCEKIQHLGAKKDELGLEEVDEDYALKSIKEILVFMKQDYADARKWLNDYFGPGAED